MASLKANGFKSISGDYSPRRGAKYSNPFKRGLIRGSLCECSEGLRKFKRSNACGVGSSMPAPERSRLCSLCSEDRD